MTVVRLRYETNVAYWQKVRTSDNRIAYMRIGKDDGLARWKAQTSFAAAGTHKIEDIRNLGTIEFEFYQRDNSDKFSSYDDAIELGFFLNPPVSFLDLKESLFPEDPSLIELRDYINGLYLDMHGMRENYQGIFWGIHYIVNREDSSEASVRHTDMISLKRDDPDLLSDQFISIWGDMIRAFEGYSDVIVQNVFVKLRNNDLEL